MTDDRSPTDADAASDSVEEFPSKLRVHALARVLGLTSRQVLAHLADLGWATRSPQSSVERSMAQAVADKVRGAGDGPETEAEPDAAQPDAAQPDTAESAAAANGAAAQRATSVAEADDEPSGHAAPSTGADQGPPMLFSAADSISHDPVAVVDDVAVGPLFLQPEVSTERQRVADGTGADHVTPGQVGEPTATTTHATTDRTKTDGATTDEADSRASDARDGSAGDDDSGEGGRNRRRRRGRRGRGRGRGDHNERPDDEQVTDAAAEAGSTQDASAAVTADGDTSAPEDAPKARGKRKSKKKTSGDTAAADAETTGSATADEAESGSSESDPSESRAAGPDAGEPDDAGTGDAGSDREGSDGDDSATAEADDTDDGDGDVPTSKRRRRRRRRKGGAAADDAAPDDPPNTVVHEREPRSKRVRDEVQGISGSTRLEAKRQRRRDGRDAGRRRPPILSESEFLARREAVERVMVVRERGANAALNVSHPTDHTPIEDYTQVAVLEDGVLVEHFVTTETSSSMVGNIYLGRVQNVLPGMEAAFVDIGRGRNGVLYAGEVNWDAAGLDGGSRKIEQALSPGDTVVVQVSKDPVGHKGARLTTQISLAGRYLVYVPGGSSTGISRKLPDVERKRLKQLLAKLVPDDAGVIIRTASEGVSAEDLGTDIKRLESKWQSIEAAVADAKKGNGGSHGPRALYEEPDLLVRVVRDLFNEDFRKLVVEGAKAWDLVEGYVSSVAPDLLDRVEKFERPRADSPDSFVVHRIDEQLAKALDRKVWLPSGGTLIIEHTEAMTVVDVNTGKFTGAGGNLEETVTRNNLEAAEEIVRQMRLRDIGGMIIVDFIDMVLESNRDLVLRRLTEALARDRTRHQVSEVTSLGLVQMTRKRLGTGLLEAFSTTCAACGGRGVIVHSSPVEVKSDEAKNLDGGNSKRSRRNKRKSEQSGEPDKLASRPAEHPMFRAMAQHSHESDDHLPGDASSADESVAAHTAIDAGTADSAAQDAGDTQNSGTEPQSDTPTVGDDTNKADASQQDGGAQVRPTRRSRSRRAAAQSNRQQSESSASSSPREAEPVVPSQVSDSASAASPHEPAPNGTGTSTAGTNGTDTNGTGANGTGSSGGDRVAVARPRRRVVRRAASPTAQATATATLAPADTTAHPLTTFGPITTTASGQEAVAVRRRPRRRAAGRPAGPPVDE